MLRMFLRIVDTYFLLRVVSTFFITYYVSSMHWSVGHERQHANCTVAIFIDFKQRLWLKNSKKKAQKKNTEKKEGE